MEGAGTGEYYFSFSSLHGVNPKDGRMCTWTNMYTRVRPSRRRIEVAIVIVLVGRY